MIYWKLIFLLFSLVYFFRSFIKCETIKFQLYYFYFLMNSNLNKLYKLSSSVKLKDFQLSSNQDCIKIISWLLYHFSEIKALIFWLYIWFDLNLIWIHTFLWHWFRLNSWETLCYLYWVNKTFWKRKSLVIYTTTLRRWNNDHETMYQVCIYSFYSACDA